MIKVIFALVAAGLVLGGCGMTVATPRPHPVAASVHAGPPPMHRAGYGGHRRGAERRPVCEEGDRFDPHIGKCVGEPVYLDPRKGSEYDVSPAQARCTPDRTRSFRVPIPGGYRVVHQTCRRP